MLTTKNPYIDSAYHQLQIISQDKQKRLEYETREKAIRDHNQMMYEAEQRGIQIGEQRGIQIGELRAKMEIILSMHNSGMSINQIASIVKINLDENNKPTKLLFTLSGNGLFKEDSSTYIPMEIFFQCNTPGLSKPLFPIQ